MTDEFDVVVSEDVWGPALQTLANRWRVLHEPGLWQDRKRLEQACSRAKALMVRNRTGVDKELIAASPGLRIVARAGVGLDNIDLAAADRAGVVVAAPLGANAISVAEHALGLALALARNTVALDRDVRAGGWCRTPGTELNGGTWGLLGAGATARACARLATALGMRVLAFDPYIDPDHPGLGEVRLASLEEVAAGSDVLSCHLPATAETASLVDEPFLARMRPTALFINVGRGEVVDELALADALDTGRIAGAALDVRGTEPPLAGRLEKTPNTLLTPHIAGITTQSQDRILRTLTDDIDAVLCGQTAKAAVGSAKEARS